MVYDRSSMLHASTGGKEALHATQAARKHKEQAQQSPAFPYEHVSWLVDSRLKRRGGRQVLKCKTRLEIQLRRSPVALPASQLDEKTSGDVTEGDQVPSDARCPNQMQTLAFFAPNLHIEYHDSPRPDTCRQRGQSTIKNHIAAQRPATKDDSLKMLQPRRCNSCVPYSRSATLTPSTRSRQNCLHYIKYLEDAEEMNVEADAVLLDLESPAGLRPYRHLPTTRPLSAACVSPREGQSHVPIHIKWCMRMHAARTSGFWSTRRGVVGARRIANGGGASGSRDHDEASAVGCLQWVVCGGLSAVCCVLWQVQTL
jgi:hypothetical protein